MTICIYDSPHISRAWIGTSRTGGGGVYVYVVNLPRKEDSQKSNPRAHLVGGRWRAEIRYIYTRPEVSVIPPKPEEIVTSDDP